MNEFLLCFVPLFVAVDSIGVLPLFINFTEGLEWQKIKKIILQSILTAMFVAITFVTLGKLILHFLGITIADFMIAGGILLFIISMVDLQLNEKNQRKIVDREQMGVVPIGVPLIVGPAVLTTSILLVDTYGIIPTLIALILNILIAGLVFSLSNPILKIIGKAGAKTISKLASLLLASIAVMIVRKGITMILK